MRFGRSTQDRAASSYRIVVARWPAPGRLVALDGFRLHIQCSGQGTPAVVCDAALGGSSLSWSLVQPDLARITTVCSYDRAGFAWSDAGPMPRTAGRIADELRTLLDRADVPTPYVLTGHSFGGLVVRIFASRYRRDTAGVVLIDPAHPEEWLEPSADARAQIDRGRRLCRHGAWAARTGIARLVSLMVSAGALDLARGIATVVSRGGLSREDEGILAPIWRLPREVRKPLRYFWTRADFYAALGSQIESICASAAEVAAAPVSEWRDLPFVTISSSDASPQRRQLQDALARQCSRGRHIVAPNSGHWILLDQPQVVIDAIREVVMEVRSRESLNPSS
jgi:pimeloyl-ACP methyl ester carboxylesterase